MTTKPASKTAARDYRKAYVKLLTAVASVPKAVDEYFFGTADEQDAQDASVKPYFYGCSAFIITVTLFIYVGLGRL